MFESLLKVLGAGLSIWESKEKRKYWDKYIELRKAYYEESNKPDSQRDDAKLDNIKFELRLLGDAFSANAAKPDLEVKS